MEFFQDSTLDVPFTVNVKKVSLDPDRNLLPLIQKFKELISSQTIPEGLPGCSECAKLVTILQLVSGANIDLTVKTEKLSRATGGLMIEN